METIHEEFLLKIESLSGRSKEDIIKIAQPYLSLKHSELRTFLMETLHLSYGYANTLTHVLQRSDGGSLYAHEDIDEVAQSFYDGKKAHLYPIHQKVIDLVRTFEAVEILPKKGYLSLKHKKQFALIGPKSSTRIELGINLHEGLKHPRLVAQAKGSMCKYIINLTSIEEVDEQLRDWITLAYQQAK